MKRSRPLLRLTLAVSFALLSAAACRDFDAKLAECKDGGPCFEDGGSDAGDEQDGGVVVVEDAGPPDAGYPPGSRNLGQSCAATVECEAPRHCTEGVCCEFETCGTCSTCADPNNLGGCAVVAKGDDPKNECAGDPDACVRESCNGGGSCAAVDDEVCAPATCASSILTTRRCSGGTCSPFTTNCNNGCAATEDSCEGICNSSNGIGCDAGAYCDETSQCRTYLLQGAACDGQFKCEPNTYCVDGVCCQAESCGGPCESCNATGSIGTCTFVPDGGTPVREGCDDPMQCLNATCDGAGVCGRFRSGELCGSGMLYCAQNDNTKIVRDVCDPQGTCGATTLSSCVGMQVCTDPGSGPVCLLPNGAACTQDAQCASNACVQGGCCGATCNSCELCDASNSHNSCVMGSDPNCVPDGGP